MLNQLMETYGIAGREDAVRSVITKALKQSAIDYYIDKMGNLHAVRDGAGKRYFLAAYMDEPGIIVTKITEDGYLKFDTVGRIEPAFLVSKRVIIGGCCGIISLKAIHLATKAERETPVRTDQLYIDIGAASAADAAECVEIGDYGVLDSRYRTMAHDFVKGRALAGRMGCFAVLEVLQNTDVPMHAVFAVQREIGCRGMTAAVWQSAADVSIVLDGIADQSPDGKKDTLKVGDGVVLIRRTGSGSMDASLWKLAANAAKEHGVPVQYGNLKERGQEGALMQNGGGHRCLCLAVPVRYMRSCAQVASLKDMRSMIACIKGIIEESERGSLG